MSFLNLFPFLISLSFSFFFSSLNPLSMMEALIGAMKHSAVLEKERGGELEEADRLIEFAEKLQKSIHAQV